MSREPALIPGPNLSCRPVRPHTLLYFSYDCQQRSDLTILISVLSGHDRINSFRNNFFCPFQIFFPLCFFHREVSLPFLKIVPKLAHLSCGAFFLYCPFKIQPGIPIFRKHRRYSFEAPNFSSYFPNFPLLCFSAPSFPAYHTVLPFFCSKQTKIIFHVCIRAETFPTEPQHFLFMSETGRKKRRLQKPCLRIPPVFQAILRKPVMYISFSPMP